ncbi:MAG: alpha/beta hydrolase family protein, partial [Planctomycetota bacterium]
MALRGQTMASGMIVAAVLAGIGMLLVMSAGCAGPGGGPATDAAPSAEPALTFEQYVEELSEQALARRNQRIAALKSTDDVLRWARELKQWYRRRVGPIVPLTGPQRTELCGRIQRDGYHVEKWLFETMPGTWSTSHLYVPAAPNAAGVAVVAPIGHWKQGKFCVDYQRLGAYMARNGVAVLVYEHPGLGERREFHDPVRDQPRAGRSPTSEHDRTGLPMALAGIQPARFYITEALRAREFMATFPFVRADRIGFTGASGGGSLTREVACYSDEVAFAIPVVIIRGEDIGGLGDSEQAVWSDGTRGVTYSDQLTAAVPRPVMVITERPDDGSRQSYATLRKIYDLAGAPADVTDYYAEDTTHAYHRSMIERVYAFLARQF